MSPACVSDWLVYFLPIFSFRLVNLFAFSLQSWSLRNICMQNAISWILWMSVATAEESVRNSLWGSTQGHTYSWKLESLIAFANASFVNNLPFALFLVSQVLYYNRSRITLFNMLCKTICYIQQLSALRQNSKLYIQESYYIIIFSMSISLCLQARFNPTFYTGLSWTEWNPSKLICW